MLILEKIVKYLDKIVSVPKAKKLTIINYCQATRT